MARSGSISSATDFGSISLAWEIISQSGMQSTVQYTLAFNLNPKVILHSPGSVEYKVLINGATVSNGSTKALQGSIVSSQTIMTHKSDGTKSAKMAFFVNFTDTVEIYTSAPPWTSTFVDIGLVTGTGTAELAAIAPPTVPVLTPTDLYFGDTLTISTPRKSNKYTHNLYWRLSAFEDITTNPIASNVTESWLWTIPMDAITKYLGPQRATSIALVIICQTYDESGLLVGTKTASVTARVPDSAAPKINDLTITDPEEHAIIFASYVQKKSRVRFTFKPEGQYGATIKSYKATVAGVTIPFDPVTLEDGSVQITSGLLNPSGYVDLTLTVTDIRGLSTTQSNTIYVHEYAAPTITRFTAARANANKEEDDDGTYVKFGATFSIAPIAELNDKVLTIQYKKKSKTEWQTLQTSEEHYTFDGYITSLTPVLTEDDPYDFKLIITDYFGSVSTAAEVAVAFTLIDWHKNGRALAFGKVCEIEEGIEFDLPVHFRKTGKVLWSGAYWMTGDHTITLSEPISSQMTGIVLIFSRYLSGAASDMQFNTFFVHKKHVELFPEKTTQFLLSTDGLFGKIASKVLKFSDDIITGVNNNSLSGTSNGITYDNSAFVLRYVIGV